MSLSAHLHLPNADIVTSRPRVYRSKLPAGALLFRQSVEACWINSQPHVAQMASESSAEVNRVEERTGTVYSTKNRFRALRRRLVRKIRQWLSQHPEVVVSALCAVSRGGRDNVVAVVMLTKRKQLAREEGDEEWLEQQEEENVHPRKRMRLMFDVVSDAAASVTCAGELWNQQCQGMEVTGEPSAQVAWCAV